MANYSPGARRVLDLLHDRTVAFHPGLVPLLGGPDEALLVSQLLFWDGKGSAPARWIYKTQGEWEREIGLSVYRQRRARRRLRELGVLEERRGGMPARLYYRLNLDVLATLVDAFSGSVDPDRAALASSSGQDAGQDRDTVAQLAGDTYAALDREDPPVKSSPTPTTISEKTAQITTRDGAGSRPLDLVKIWRRVCANVRLKVPSRSFEAWILPCVLCGLEETSGQIRAYVETRSQDEREWLAHRMGNVLPCAFREELGCEVEVIYCLPGEDPPVPTPGPATAVGAGLRPRPSPTDAPAPPSAVGPPKAPLRAPDAVRAGLANQDSRARPLPTDAPAPPSPACPPQASSDPAPSAPVRMGPANQNAHPRLRVATVGAGLANQNSRAGSPGRSCGGSPDGGNERPPARQRAPPAKTHRARC